MRNAALKQMTRGTLAYCYASGHIEFTDGKLPDGALPIARGVGVREIVEARARWSYPDEEGVEHPLVPGVPEAPDQLAALAAMQKFNRWIEAAISKPAV